MPLLRRRMMIAEMESETVKEWALLKNFDFSENANEVTLTGLDCSEIYIETRGLANASNAQNQYAYVYINGASMGNVDTQKNSSPSADKFQKIGFAYNGLCWKSEKTPQCNNDSEMYRTSFVSMQTAYVYPNNIGATVETLAIKATTPTYAIISGNVKIYGR